MGEAKRRKLAGEYPHQTAKPPQPHGHQIKTIKNVISGLARHSQSQDASEDMARKKLIQITQDAAGVIESSNSNVLGFFTGGIQTCLVTIYECSKASILIHDSGQLLIENIVDLVKSYGEVNKVIASFGPKLNGDHHQARLNDISSKVGFSMGREVNVLESPIDTFAFLYPLGDTPVIVHNDEPSLSVEQLPDREKRETVNEINNFFIEPNSQSLRLDLQYVGGRFTPSSVLSFTSQQLLDTLKSQPRFFFTNLAFLEKAHMHGLINLPVNLISLAAEHRVSKYRGTEPAGHQLKEQSDAFSTYFQTHLQTQ